MAHQLNLNSEVIWELGVEIRVRQSPDWRFASRHSGEWRSRDRRQAEINLNSRVESIPNALGRGVDVIFLLPDREMTGQTEEIIQKTKDNLRVMSRFSGRRARNRRHDIYPPHIPTSDFRLRLKTEDDLDFQNISNCPSIVEEAPARITRRIPS